VFVLAHSTGGTVALHFAALRPGAVTAYALSSPLVDPDYGSLPPLLVESLSAGQCSRSSGASYAPGGGPYDASAEVFEGNDVTRCHARFSLKVQMFLDHPELRLGGPSWRWVCEVASHATATLRRLDGDVRDRVCMMLAGADTVVRTGAARAWCDAARRCQYDVFPEARHELLQETDPARNETLARALRFVAYHASPSRP
jgi:lysophospholipase